jgi:serine/threonine-protein kinase
VAAAELGRATGAQLAVFGQLVSSGRDSVRLTATLLDVRTGRTLGDVERHDAVDRVDRLADSVTVALLRALERTRPIGAGRIASVGSASLVALKSFLQGEQYLRRSAWDSAIAHYERAAVQDPEFALAYNRLSLALGWVRSGADSLSRAYGERAGALNHGLAPRDSLLLVADSLRSVLFGSGDPAYWPRARRMFATLEEAVRRYPADPSVWYNLAEAYHHFGLGPGLDVSIERTRLTFDRAIALDTAFAPSYIHQVELALNAGDVGSARRYARTYLDLQATDISAGAIRLVALLLDQPNGNLRAMLDTVHADVLAHVVWSMIGRWTDTTEWAVRLAQELSPARVSEHPTYTDPRWIRTTRAVTLAYRGHLAAARGVIGTEAGNAWDLAQIALLGGVAPDTAGPFFAAWLAQDPMRAHPLLPWFAALGDTAPIRRFTTVAESLARAPASPAAAARAGYAAGVGAAYLALAAGDTARALRRFTALPDTLCISCGADRLTEARLLAAAGRLREADALLGPRLARLPQLLEPLVALERARVREALGDRDGARAAFGFVASVWRRADPVLQPYVEEATAALVRLGAESR